MPYDNAYNRQIRNELFGMMDRFLEHQEKTLQSEFISPTNENFKVGGSGFGEGTYRDTGFGFVEGCKSSVLKKPVYKKVSEKVVDDALEMEGKGLVDDIKKVARRAKRTVKSVGKILTKKGDFKDLANISTLGNYGEHYGDGKTPHEVGMTAQEKLNKVEQEGGNKKIDKIIEMVEKKKGKGRPKKGAGIISAITGFLGLGKEGEQKAGVKILKKGGSMSGRKIGGSILGDLKRGMTAKGKSGGNILDDLKRGMTAKGKENEKLAMEIKGLKDRVVKKGGRKLLTREEMPPSQMSGNGASGGKKTNPYIELVKKIKNEHPELKGVKAITKYIKDNNLYQKK